MSHIDQGDAPGTDLIKGETDAAHRALEAIAAIPDAYAQDVKQLVRFIENAKLGFTPEGIKAWVSELDRRLSTNQIGGRSYNKKLAALKHRMRWLFKRADLTLDPKAVRAFKAYLEDMKPVKISRSEIRVSPDRVLPPEKIEELRKAADKRLGLMIEFMRDTGCRVTEMTTAGLGKSRREGVEIELVGKGRKMRRVKIERDLYDRILAEFHGSTYLFEHNGKPYSRIAITNRLRALSGELWGRNAKVGAHVMRHSFVTEALKQGVPIEQVADYVGHSSPDTTHRQYDHNVLDWTKTFKGMMKREGV